MDQPRTDREGGEAFQPSLGLYVHVPFCSSTCDFCAFYQTVPTAGDLDRFVTGIGIEAGLGAWDAPVATVFRG